MLAPASGSVQSLPTEKCTLYKQMVTLLDIPVLRETPPELAIGLAEIDPNLFAVALCRDRFLVAYRSDHPDHIRRGRQILANTKRGLAAIEAKNPGRDFRMVPRMRDRLIVASVKALGVTGAKIYQSQYPHSALIAEIRETDWYQRHTTEAEFWQQYHDVEQAAKDAADAALTDPHRAHDAWQYAFTRSHGVTNYDSTRNTTAPRATSSARTLHRSL